jgi:XTP/dITP diphosphohydrolase
VEHLFEGLVNGHIRQEQFGTGGFGYDPVFVPDGYSVSFAEMDKEEKNRISHRGRAVQKLLDFLKQA